jgi:hypothetical protein
LKLSFSSKLKTEQSSSKRQCLENSSTALDTFTQNGPNTDLKRQNTKKKKNALYENVSGNSFYLFCF